MHEMKIVDTAALEAVADGARKSPRLRMNANLHAMDDAVHRLLNAFEPGSYVRPHRHLEPPKGETLTVLRGRGAVLVFDDAGRVTSCAVLSPHGPAFVVEVPAGAWHSLVALESGTVWFEAKEGPYVQPAAGDWAAWAPDPASPDAGVYLEKMRAEVVARIRQSD